MFLLFAIGPAQAADWPTIPDHSLTKGATVPGITVQKICSTKWGADARHVTAAMKRSVVGEHQFDVHVCPRNRYSALGWQPHDDRETLRAIAGNYPR
jgi:hypothetical protein